MSKEEKKWLLKRRVEDIPVKTNRRWQFDNILCSFCNTNSEETQSHILECKTLIGPSKIVTYIPNYQKLFESNIESQAYVSRLLKDNHGRIAVSA